MLQYLTGQLLTGLVGAKGDPNTAEATVAAADTAPDGTDFLQVMIEGEGKGEAGSGRPGEYSAPASDDPENNAQAVALADLDKAETPVETANLTEDIDALSPESIDLPRFARTPVPALDQSEPTFPDSEIAPAWMGSQDAPELVDQPASAVIDPAYRALRAELPAQGGHTPSAQSTSGQTVVSAMVSSDAPETGSKPGSASPMVSSVAQDAIPTPSAPPVTVASPTKPHAPEPELMPQSDRSQPRLIDPVPSRDPALVKPDTDTANAVPQRTDPAPLHINPTGAPTPFVDNTVSQTARDPNGTSSAGQATLAASTPLSNPARPVVQPPSATSSPGGAQADQHPDHLVAADRSHREASTPPQTPSRIVAIPPTPAETGGLQPSTSPAAAALMTNPVPKMSHQSENLGSHGELPIELRGPMALAPGQRAPVQSTAARADIPRHMAIQMAEAVRAGGPRPIDLMLNPAELGRVKISLQSAEGAVLVHITADRPETLDLMRRHLDDLTQEFQSAGYSDAQFSFSDENPAGEGDSNPDGDVVASAADAPDSPEPTQTSTPGIMITDRVDIRI